MKRAAIYVRVSTKEQKENILENLNYIDYIMNTWIEDFKLNSKIKKQIERKKKSESK